MDNHMDIVPGAAGYRLSNPSVLNVVCVLGSMNVFAETSMDYLVKRSHRLTGYLAQLMQQLGVTIITPKERGCQLSLYFGPKMPFVFEQLSKQNIVCDERKPDVIRVSPTALYNTFQDVWGFYTALRDILPQI